MKYKHALLLLFTFTSLSACSSFQEAIHPKKSSEKTLHLTLVPTEQIAQGKATAVDAKITHVKSRALLTNENTALTGSLYLYALDTSFTDLQRIEAAPAKISGLYHFTFTPRARSSYRLWAESRLDAETVEYPFADLGTRTPGSFPRTESLSQTVDGITYTLSSEDKLKRFYATELTLQAAGKTIHIIDAVSIYDDYRTLMHFATEPGKPLTFAPDREGFVKLFIRANNDGKEVALNFTVSIEKD